MSALGKTYAPVTYAVGREKVREYAHAVGETNPLHLDVEAARGRRPPRRRRAADVRRRLRVAAVSRALFDPEVGMDFARMVHGAQEFTWGPLVVAGDEITTEVEVAEHLRARRAWASTSSSRARTTRTASGSAPAAGPAS